MRRSEGGYTVDRLNGRLLPVTFDVPGDPDVEAVLADHAQALGEIVGTLESTLVATEEGPSPLGQLAAEAVRSATGSDISMVHRNWVGSSLEAGPITVGDLVMVHPDREPVLTAQVKGSVIGGLGRLPGQLFSGCEVEDSTIVRIADVAVDTAAFYRLSAPASVFTWVEGLLNLSTFRTGYRIDTAIERYIRLKGLVQPN